MPACQNVVVSCVVTNKAEVIMSDRTVGRGVILGLKQCQRVHLGSIYIAQQASCTTSSIDKCTFCPTWSAFLSHLGICANAGGQRAGNCCQAPHLQFLWLEVVVEMVLNPFKFWEAQRQTSFPGALPVKSMHVPPSASQDMTSP